MSGTGETQALSGGRDARRSTIFVAILYGLSCHIAFIAGVGTMMIVLFGGMAGAWGRVPAPWAWPANAVLLLQFPMLHTALLSKRGGMVLRRLAPARLGARLMSTTYALIASVQTGLLFLAWTPSGKVLWQAQGRIFAIIAIFYGTAWLLLLKSILDADFALQTGLLGWAAAVRGRAPVYPPMPTRGLFRLIRQPIYASFALTLWTVPTITLDGLAVSLVLTVYCLIGPLFKEARFARRFGPEFAAYRDRVPYWLPWPRKGGKSAAPAPE